MQDLGTHSDVYGVQRRQLATREQCVDTPSRTQKHIPQAWTPKLEFVAEVNHIFRVPPKVPNLDLCKVAASRAEILVQGAT